MDAQKPDSQREETAEEKRKRYMTEEERREWTMLDEWRDPLDRDEPEPAPHEGKFALASLLCGVVSLLTICTGYGNAIFGAAAIILGIIAKKKHESTEKMAVVGIVAGIVGLCSALALLGIWIFRNIAAQTYGDPYSDLPV